MTNFRTMLMGTAAVGLIALNTVPSASAADVEKKMAWSGFVNRAMITGDDGENYFTSHTDPSGVAQSRGRIKASAKSASMEVGALIELGLSNGANATQFANGGAAFSVRHSRLHIKNGAGTLFMGHTSHAGENYIMTDVSGTSLASSGGGSPFDGVLFNNSDSTPGSPAAGTTVGTAHGDDMSGGRASGITYGSPKFNGFSAQVSHVTDAGGAAHVKYGGDFGGVKVSGGYSYAGIATGSGTLATAATDHVHGGGIGIELANGLNLSANYREEVKNTANTNDDPSIMYTVLGYKMTGLSDLGGTNIAVAYKVTDDAVATGDKFKSVNLQVTQALSSYGTTIYGGYSHMRYDTTASDFDDLNGVFAGVKVDF
jgi:hypothetical protein